MSRKHLTRNIGSALGIVTLCGTASLQAAIFIPSPANDLLLASNGGVADINGSTVDGGGQNYGGLPPANLNDGDRDGVYNNGSGVDAAGSIAHTAAAGANQWMGVKLPAPTLIGTVDIFNRADCCDGRLDNSGQTKFTLNILNGASNVFTGDFFYTPTISLSAGAGHSATGMVIPTNVIGDYVQVIQHHSDYMNLAEIEAYAAPEPASLTLIGLGAIGLLIRRR